MNSPKITVLMPVYNAEKYLNEATNSILNQSFTDFEFLIINDGSTDDSKRIIQSYNDRRIRYVENEKNLGLIETLNKGFDLALGEYIARMDADDISLPNRLEEQVRFLESSPDIGIVGSQIKTIGDIDGYIRRRPTNPDEIKCALLFDTPLAHPSVVIRKKVFADNGLKYDPDFKHAEDYELWTRAVDCTKAANIDKVLLYYRIHQKSVSHTYHEEQSCGAELVRTTQLKKIGITPTAEELILHQKNKVPETMEINEFLDKKEEWLLKILHKNQERLFFSPSHLLTTLQKQWLAVCDVNAKKGLFILRIYFKSPLRNIKENKKAVLKLLVKTILKI